MAGPITAAQLQRCTFRCVAHLNMGSSGHAYEHRCAEFPEFRVIRSSLRKPSRVRQTFFVGDQEVPTLQAAADALNALWPNRAHRTLAEVDQSLAASDQEADMKVPLDVQVRAVAREIAMRRNVYPHRIAKASMTQAEADTEIAAMEAVAATLAWVQRHRERLLALAPELAEAPAAGAAE